MLGMGSLVIGLVMLVVVASWVVRRFRGGNSNDAPRSGDELASWERHRDAQAREPPVEIGDVCEAGVVDFSTHHTGERHAVCKVEGFVVFVEDVPDDLAVGDVCRFKILSYNRGHTSATATALET
ncbi:RNA-binding protein [Natrialbaceae archaeon AArc-T1-2]|uniref:RNA-binding protein n=1 Tax=Natrialbaceae archaeon AArc-T1-2 TaxID=3053904 RepID=UPI00255AA032|nr:RNA-binding protein [Natrialbaceae archaeon AArc-T1-2]WIV66241.1 RNA-binding protein [Natrialbaceae archaeon AArc-T1-2]